MTFDKYTIKAQEAVQAAVQAAQQGHQQSVEPIHLLSGIINKGKDITNFVFQKLGANAQSIEMALQQELQHLPKVDGGQPYLSNDLTQVVNNAEAISQQWGDEFVSIEPLLLSLMKGNNTAGRIMKDAGCEKLSKSCARGKRFSHKVVMKTINLSTNTLSISLNVHGKESLIPSSEEMKRYVVCFRS